MRVVDYRLANDYAVTIAALANDTLTVWLRSDLKIHAIDVTIVFDAADVWSKDVTFRLTEQIGQTEDYAFWAASVGTIFSDFMKLVNRTHSNMQIHIVNNHAANPIVVETVYVRIYYYD